MNVERPRVIIESPYAGDIQANTKYALQAMWHSIKQGEAPFASHIIYPLILDESKPEDRELGIELGYNWLIGANRQVFYMDRGFSPGMKKALEFGWSIGVPTEARWLFGPVNIKVFDHAEAAMMSYCNSFATKVCA
jgi:hypothetical protein